MRLALAAAIAAVSIASHAQPAGKTCGDFPALDVTTPPGFCAAVLSTEFKFPRGVRPLANGDLIIVDMGGWAAKSGSVWRMKKRDARYDRQLLISKLDRPNSVTLGPDGLVYVGEVGRIFRFDPQDPAGTMKDVIGGNSRTAPLPGLGRHAMPTMRFDRKGDLFINIGSASDHCESSEGLAPVPDKPCAEAEGREALGTIRKYSIEWPAGEVTRWEVHARGLRNSMAIAFHPATNELWQADNARDFINLAMSSLKHDQELPHDELNLVKSGGHYGWPYCYDANVASPEYPSTKCAAYRAPVRLLPAHAAPLGMLFYTADRYPPQYKNSLIISFHGYRQHGHRLVALLPDKAGAPKGRMVNLISGWGNKKKQRMGAPVGVAVGPEGDLYLVEDRAGRVIQLQYQTPTAK